MAETKKEKPEELATSKEMRKFYRVLAAAHTNSIFRVMSGKDAKDIKERAKKETEILREAAGQPPEGRNCPVNQVWDEVTQRCIEI